MIGSYDHIPDGQRAGMVAESARILKPGGALVVCMTNDGAWYWRLLRFLGQGHRIHQGPEHHCAHDAASLAREISQAAAFATASVCGNGFFLPNVRRLFTIFPFRSSWFCARLDACLRVS